MKKVEFGFRGKLNKQGFPLDLCDKSIEILLRNDILICADYTTPLKLDQSSVDLTETYFKNKIYTINEVIVSEIFNCLRVSIEVEWYAEVEVDNLRYEINSILLDEDKIDYLKREYNKIYISNFWFDIFMKYINDKDGDQWEFHLKSLIKYYQNVVIKYLVTENTSVLSIIKESFKEPVENDDFLNLLNVCNRWLEFYCTWAKLTFIIEEILKIQPVKQKMQLPVIACLSKIIGQSDFDELILKLIDLEVLTKQNEFKKVITTVILSDIQVASALGYKLLKKYPDKIDSKEHLFKIFKLTFVINFSGSSFRKFIGRLEESYKDYKIEKREMKTEHAAISLFNTL